MIKQSANVALIAAMLGAPLLASAACDDEATVRQLDARWEHELNAGTPEGVMEILHPEYVWVHNHAGSMTSSREEFMQSYRRSFGHANNIEGKEQPGSRVQHDVQTRISPDAAIVFGYLDKTSPGKATVYYHFMRTWVEHDGQCVLLANHTQNLPREE